MRRSAASATCCGHEPTWTTCSDGWSSDDARHVSGDRAVGVVMRSGAGRPERERRTLPVADVDPAGQLREEYAVDQPYQPRALPKALQVELEGEFSQLPTPPGDISSSPRAESTPDALPEIWSGGPAQAGGRGPRESARAKNGTEARATAATPGRGAPAVGGDLGWAAQGAAVGRDGCSGEVGGSTAPPPGVGR